MTTWNIPNFLKSNVSQLYSNTFDLGGCRWKVRTNPKWYRLPDYFPLFLLCCSDPEVKLEGGRGGRPRTIQAKYSFTLVDQKRRKKEHKEEQQQSKKKRKKTMTTNMNDLSLMFLQKRRKKRKNEQKDQRQKKKKKKKKRKKALTTNMNDFSLAITPWIRSSVSLKKLPFKEPVYEFGFDSDTGEHKVICVWHHPPGSSKPRSLPLPACCEVLTVGVHASWRIIDANGSVYWRTRPYGSLLEFDMEPEKYRTVRIPEFIDRGNNGEKRSFLSLVEVSGLSSHEKFLCRLTISSLNLLKVISEQEGCEIEELNAGKVARTSTITSPSSLTVQLASKNLLLELSTMTRDWKPDENDDSALLQQQRDKLAEYLEMSLEAISKANWFRDVKGVVEKIHELGSEYPIHLRSY
ncbi:hypothetical protein LINGRAHAP2_LOCUS35965 [Linum grandiflorum]